MIKLPLIVIVSAAFYLITGRVNIKSVHRNIASVLFLIASIVYSYEFWAVFLLIGGLFLLGYKFLNAMKCNTCSGKGLLHGPSPYMEARFSGHKCYVCNGVGFYVKKEWTKVLGASIDSRKRLEVDRRKMMTKLTKYKRKVVRTPLVDRLRIGQCHDENINRYQARIKFINKGIQFCRMVERIAHQKLFLSQQWDIVSHENEVDEVDKYIDENASLQQLKFDFEMESFGQNEYDQPASPTDVDFSVESEIITDLIKEVDAAINSTRAKFA